MDTSRLATVIFDSGRKLPESEYSEICEDISNDRFSINPIVTQYKKKEAILESLLYVLDDGSRVLVSEETVKRLSDLNTIDKKELTKFMRVSRDNFSKAIGVINDNS